MNGVHCQTSAMISEMNFHGFPVSQLTSVGCPMIWLTI
jgi:hypothetical protein